MKTLSITIGEDMYNAISNYAKYYDKSKSQVAREAFEYFFEPVKPPVVKTTKELFVEFWNSLFR